MSGDTHPVLVARALRASLEAGFVDTTRTETGRLLATLAAGVDGPIGDCGTGCGVGAAWMRSSAPQGVAVFTVESDKDLAERAADTFHGQDVTVLHGDWTELRSHGPFALITTDHALARQDIDGEMIDLLAPGAIAVIDDLQPRSWSSYDPVRHVWLDDPRVVAVELPICPDASVIVATRARSEVSDS